MGDGNGDGGVIIGAASSEDLCVIKVQQEEHQQNRAPAVDVRLERRVRDKTFLLHKRTEVARENPHRWSYTAKSVG